MAEEICHNLCHSLYDDLERDSADDDDWEGDHRWYDECGRVSKWRPNHFNMENFKQEAQGLYAELFE